MGGEASKPAAVEEATNEPVLATDAFVKERLEEKERREQEDAEAAQAALREKQRIESAKERAKALEQKVGMLAGPVRCGEEEREAVECVKNNPNDSMACRALVARFEKCSWGKS